MLTDFLMRFRPDNAVPTTDAKGFQKRERGEEGRYAREKVNGLFLIYLPIYQISS